MSRLSDLQDRLQADILREGREAEELIAPAPRGSRASRLDVYRQAYVLRLTEFLSNDYEKLRTYLGETRFSRMARDYAAAHPSDTPNARWFSRHLPAYLRQSKAFLPHPEVAELAALEQALNDVFDGPEAAPATMADLAAIDPAQFGAVRFALVPACMTVETRSNAASIWSAIRCGETPPAAEQLDHPQQILVWRQASSSRFRILGEEEFMALSCVVEGLDFATICEMLAAYDDPDTAAFRAANYLRGWIEAEILVMTPTEF
jgi:hypothetical protein